jgi:NitT/TauT family transport system substrate-binding protein/putative hydroxymethylpyrimidine transport system substrate-binding protein
MRRPPTITLAAVAAALALTLALGGCGEDEPATTLPATTKATLVLDFLPNAVHAGIYRAVAAGYYADNGLDLRIIQPSSTADTLKLIDAGKADIGIADAVDVMGQIDAGREARAIMAVVQRPLGGLITRAEDRITSPRQLEGRRVGITGVPSDTAILDTIVEDAGGDPARVEKLTIGFNGVQNLTAGKLQGFVGYYPADGVQVEVDGTPTRTFTFDEYGGPAYPGLVAFSTRGRIAQDPAVLRAFVAATVRGYEDAIRRPAVALADLLRENPALERELTRAQLEAYAPLFQAGAPAFGGLDPARIDELSAFLVARDLIDAPVPARRFGTDAFLPPR